MIEVLTQLSSFQKHNYSPCMEFITLRNLRVFTFREKKQVWWQFITFMTWSKSETAKLWARYILLLFQQKYNILWQWNYFLFFFFLINNLEFEHWAISSESEPSLPALGYVKCDTRAGEPKYRGLCSSSSSACFQPPHNHPRLFPFDYIFLH